MPYIHLPALLWPEQVKLGHCLSLHLSCIGGWVYVQQSQHIQVHVKKHCVFAVMFMETCQPLFCHCTGQPLP